MSQFWNQLKDRVQARGAQANSTIGIIGGADGPTAVFVSTKPDSWLGTLLGLLPWGTGIISSACCLYDVETRELLPLFRLTVAGSRMELLLVLLTLSVLYFRYHSRMIPWQFQYCHLTGV